MHVSWFLAPPYFLVVGFLCGVAGFRVGWRVGHRVALPTLQALFGWGAFVLAWSFVGPLWATASVGAWAVGTTMVSVYAFLDRPAETDTRVIRAAEYRAVMLEWLSTGVGPEARPMRTSIAHVRELIWYVAAAVISANALSVAMGAILLNRMNAYVATLLRAARRPGVVVLLGWNVWSVVRVAAYVALGAAAASPLLSLAGLRRDPGAVTGLVLFGAIGVVVDLALKLALSRPAGRRLASAVDLDAARENRRAGGDLTLDLS